MLNLSTPLELKKILEDTLLDSSSSQGLESFSFSGLQESGLEECRKQGADVFEGKVRQCISRDQVIHLVHTDRLSAFDRFITNVPFKGALLASLARYWFENLG